ncbi:MAG: prolyl oligopeptidase family serine peptidase [Pirellulaceae bacterium]
MQLVRTRLSQKTICCAAFAICLLIATGIASADTNAKHSTDKGDKLVAEYFRLETESLSRDVVSSGMNLAELESQQTTDRKRLAEMLGLEPKPERTPLEAVIEGTQSCDGFRVERLHFQPSPGLYVAANFYLPLVVDQPLPTILYVCGHARAEKDGVSFGNKTAYHHHGVWFARNGYACLIIDTVQWGEFLGEHHGTYRLKRWWWNNRGFTPAGIEAWTGMRALDYLETRKEVDASRFGITGRSGGGIYSWWVAALDQRIKVAVPVAGITTLKNYVVDGCVEGHCDCMFMVNTYRWDYPRVAALLAPRPLLISNSDKDGIFPLDGVVELHRKVRDVYQLYGAEAKLGLQITEGPHRDTQELRVHAFRWFNRFLKDDDSLIRSPAEKCIEPNELRVFDPLPADQRVTTADEWFVPTVRKPTDDWFEKLKQKTFGGWPSESDALALNVNRTAEAGKKGVHCEVYEFDSQQPYRLPLFVLRSAKTKNTDQVIVEILDQKRWDAVVGGLAAIVPAALPDDEPSAESFELLATRLHQSPEQAIVFFAPRGVGLTQWSRDEKKRTHIRRRFMLLGQTADSMRIWDVRGAVASVREIALLKNAPLTLSASGDATAWVLFASLFDQPVNRLKLQNLPKSNRDGIALLNIDRVVDLQTVIKFASTRSEMVVVDQAE